MNVLESWIGRHYFTIYNVILAILFAAALIGLVTYSPYCAEPCNLSSYATWSDIECRPYHPFQLRKCLPKAITRYLPQSAASEQQGPSAVRTSQKLDLWLVLLALATFFCAGGLGGVVCNLRGIFKYYAELGELPRKFYVPYAVRPWMGASSGLITFFVLSFLNTALSESSSPAWTTLTGRIPYIGLALLAGFGSEEFMERLKEIAKTTFGVQSASPTSPAAMSEILMWTSTAKGLEGTRMEPVKDDELVLLSGDLRGDGEYHWKIFQPENTTTSVRTIDSNQSIRWRCRRSPCQSQGICPIHGQNIGHT